MSPIIALALGPGSPPLKPVEQVLRDRPDHVFVLRAEAPQEHALERDAEIVVFTCPSTTGLATSMRANRDGRAPQLVAMFEGSTSILDVFDAHLSEPLCGRAISRLIEQGLEQTKARSGPGAGSSARARS